MWYPVAIFVPVPAALQLTPQVQVMESSEGILLTVTTENYIAAK
jgi:hypothetical protein